MRVSLSVNIDHVATVRQARGGRYPDPVRAALLCELAGADGITIHLREDRRHAQDRDVELLREVCQTRVNLEMATTEEMIAFAERVRPDLVTFVPERREERTTEGGLDVVGNLDALKAAVERLDRVSVPSSMFIDPVGPQIDASAAVGAHAIELHTGDYANAVSPDEELEKLAWAADYSAGRHPRMLVAAGHGLTVQNVGPLVASMRSLQELNIGHALVADAIFVGLDAAVKAFRRAIDDGELRR